MRRRWAASLLAAAMAFLLAACDDASTFEDEVSFAEPAVSVEKYRPQFHFSPDINFMNDPNGLVYDTSNGTWHMFFQHSPQLEKMGKQTWGHAVSDDLMTWEQLPTAIPMDELGRIFSGSVVVDEDNTSGFFNDNKAGDSKLVAVFTHSGEWGQMQSVAWSADHGLTWNKYEKNPVISQLDTLYGADFRDPKVWWEESTKEWLMIVAGGRAQIYSSPDLIHWTHESALFYRNGEELRSECPALFPVTMEDGTRKWVYTGSSSFFVVGDVVKHDGRWEFKAETDAIPTSSAQTRTYAGQFFYNDGTGQDRILMVHWMMDYSAPEILPDKRWNGVQSIAMVQGLKKIDGVYHLTSYPAEEVDAYRAGKLYNVSDLAVNEGDKNILDTVSGLYYDLEAVITPGTASEFGFKLRTGNGQETVVKYDVKNEMLVLDKTNSGADANGENIPAWGDFTGAVAEWKLHPMADGKIQLRILVDTSVIDVFGNYGDADLSDLIFPDQDSVGMEFYTLGGSVTVDRLDIWKMKSMYTGDSAE